MPYKDPQKQKEHGRKYYQANKEKVLLQAKLRWLKIKDDPTLHAKNSLRKRNKYWGNVEERRKHANEYNSSEKRKKKRSEYAKKWNAEHREEQTAKRGFRRRNCRLKVYAHYSNGTMKCAHCGFDDVRALSIDHINGGGRKHKETIGYHLEEWLVRNDFPEGFQVLCMNCQFVKRVEMKEEG